jgi:multidrug resistance efflux pump
VPGREQTRDPMTPDENKPSKVSSATAAPGGGGPRTETALPPDPGVAAPSAKAPRRVPRLVVLPLLAIVVLAGGFFGYSYWQDQALYVSTDNALVTGSLVQVGSLNAGRVVSIAVDIGDRVAREQEVATVTLPTALTTTGSGTPKIGFRETGDQMVTIRSPIDGVVVARQANPGDTVAVGQPILTVVDPNGLWVQAQIEETKIGRVHFGQPVEVTVDSLGQTLPGRVVAVNRATTATFSLIPQSNTSGNFTKVTQLVPVKIAVDYGQMPLVLGSSVEVKIRVQD